MSLFRTMLEAQVDNGAGVGPASAASGERTAGQSGDASSPQRTAVPASPGSAGADPGPPQSPDSRLVELLRREKREQDALLAEVLQRLDAQAAAIANLERPAATRPPGFEVPAASVQAWAHFSEDAPADEEDDDANAAVQSDEDPAMFYKGLWRQYKVETLKQKKEIAALQAFPKNIMESGSGAGPGSTAQSSEWDWSYTEHGWHDAAPWQWTGQASSQQWDWSRSVESNPATIAPGHAEEAQADAQYSWPDPLKDPWIARGCKDWNWAGSDWRQDGCNDWNWSSHQQDWGNRDKGYGGSWSPDQQD